ncbi:MAG TPA: glutamyl-tRNA reductase [Bacillales bacterium]|nr:glutamyl-tRNA reductase [Bacillales bacterium]
MHILMVGLNHRTAPVEIREKFTFSETEIGDAAKQLRGRKSILEAAILSTCNRTEIYVVADQAHTGRYYTKAFLAEWFGLDKESFTPFLDIREDEIAVEHLFKVACGLDSMILGETQILGQVRDGFFAAQNAEATGTIFNQVFKQAVTLAKKAHTETDINDNAVSVSYAAVELAKQIFGDLNKKNVLIIGAGKMSELTAKHLHAGGVANVTVANRTREHAEELAAKFHGKTVAVDEIEEALVHADILISSTGSDGYVMTQKQVSSAVKRRKGLPLFMVDIAVPRDIDPALHEMDGVFLYDIDDLNGIVEANLVERRKEAEKVELLIEKELEDYRDWLNTLGVVPVISALRQKALAIQSETMKSIERKMPDLTEKEKKVLRKHTKSIVNQLLRDPVSGIKEMAAEPNKEEALELFTKLFAIEDEVKQEMDKETLKSQRKEEAQPAASTAAVREVSVRS